jgi:transcriptional regulator with GAF, ATPase, and Fis domain
VQERLIRRLGENRDRTIDVRWIAATNKDLRASVADGSFRDDLYFRLAVMTLVVPPLRERGDEIEPLARAFVKRFAEREGKERLPELAAETLDALRRTPGRAISASWRT